MKFRFFSKYFPLPKFLKLQHIGISFSDFNIKAIFFDKLSPNPTLRSIIVPLEKGAIVSGNIINMDEVIRKLTEVRKNFNTSLVFFAIPDELAYVFSTSVTVSAKGNATESVAFVIEENVPLTLSDTIFDFVPTKVVKSDLEYKANVAVAACVKKEVEKFALAFHKSGFEPIGCIHESQAIAEALIPKESIGTLCIVHAREDRIGIYMVKDGIVLFSTLRSISEGDYKSQFLDEYEKFLEYRMKYDPDKDQPIKSILVCGEFECAKKVVEAITDSPNHSQDIKNIKLSNVWTNVFDIDRHLPDIPYEKSLSFAGSIGAALSEIV
jgi:Tfp pilus assembly PilM family ATPase